MKKKLSLLLITFTVIFCSAQTFEYEYSSSIKYNSSLQEYEQDTSFSRMKLVANIDEQNKLINLVFGGSNDSATLRLSIVGQSPPDIENSVTYICKGIKSDLIDNIVVRKNQNGNSLTVLVKCNKQICPNGTLNFNK